ncbi:MAG: hypothetical protein HY719_11100 [Planctomycetes bacterium]|nr:hypothetical protein [Planctomycetota bacterium]
MRVHHALIVLALFVLLAVVIVWRQVQAVALGYEVGRLELRRDAVEEDNRRLAVVLTEEKSPARLERRAREFKPPVDLVPPHEAARLAAAGAGRARPGTTNR